MNRDSSLKMSHFRYEITLNCVSPRGIKYSGQFKVIDNHDTVC